MDNRVFLEECNSYDLKIVNNSFRKLLLDNNLLDFVKPNMKIGIKLNLVTFMKPEKAATTHPILVKVLCDMLTEKGAIVTLGDSPGGLYTESALKTVYQATGITECVTNNVSLNNNFDVCQKEINGKVVKTLDCTDWLLHQDAIINFSKLKSHGMMGLSGSVKNLFGTVPGILKPEYHYRYPEHTDFANMLIDINEFYKPVLNIMDAVIGMEGNGPTAGTPREIGLLLASKNQYDLDLAACTLINLDIKHVKTVTESINRGLCANTISDVIFNKDINKYIVKDFKKIEPGKNMKFKTVGFIDKILDKILVVKPNCFKKECIGCSKCADICPAKAITMIDKKPHIDRDKCIRCFCCQEFCPVGAMKAKKNKILELFTKNKD